MLPNRLTNMPQTIAKIFVSIASPSQIYLIQKYDETMKTKQNHLAIFFLLLALFTSCLLSLLVLGLKSNRSLSESLSSIFLESAKNAPLAKEIEADKAIKFVVLKDDKTSSFFAFSTRYLEATIDLTILKEKPEAITRGLSKNDQDPIYVSNSADKDTPNGYVIFSHIGRRIDGELVRQLEPFQYQLPFQRGKKVRVSQGSNGKSTHFRGKPSEIDADFALAEGELICAARGGTVIAYCEDSNSQGPEKKYASGANFVCIKHSDGTYGEYTHLQKNGVLVHLGQSVKAGQLIARSGNTGFTTGPHLHFAVFYHDLKGKKHTLPIRFHSKNGLLLNLQEGDYVEREISRRSEHLQIPGDSPE